MPIFDAKDLDTDPDGEARLARLLYPFPQNRADARARGRIRAERGTMIPDAVAMCAVTPIRNGREPVVLPAD